VKTESNKRQFSVPGANITGHLRHPWTCGARGGERLGINYIPNEGFVRKWRTELLYNENKFTTMPEDIVNLTELKRLHPNANLLCVTELSCRFNDMPRSWVCKVTDIATVCLLENPCMCRRLVTVVSEIVSICSVPPNVLGNASLSFRIFGSHLPQDVFYHHT